MRCLLVHAAHVAHAGAGSGRCGGLGLVGNEGLGGEHHGADGSGVFQSGACDLRGVNDTRRDHVAVDFLVGVEAVADLTAGLDLLKHNAAVDTGVGRDLTDGLLQGLDDDLNTRLLIALNLADELFHSGNSVDIGGTAPINAIPAVRELCDTLEGDERTGARIVLKALEAPLRQIAKNAGLEGSVIIDKIISANKPNYGFDAQNEVYVDDMIAAGIVDPTKVTRSALENAASVAEMVLTTESLVADLPEPPAPAAPAGDMGGMGGMY